ncbi:phospholipase D family protein [Teredinibacter franksiae]|uniref:phospholipase D family protein n=1 Tax=Teredinibacter franksiae TaxID=2761453 RepID=UPI00162803D4|nr:phospholipase D family protein [Teredinibacter franksiae]
MNIKLRFLIQRCTLYTLLLLSFIAFIGCASLPSDVSRTPSYALQNTSSAELGKHIEPLLQAHPNESGFHALSRGIEALAARLVLMQDAEMSIDAQYYMWHDDLSGKAMHQQLLKAADRGVRVRLLLDDLDTAGKENTLHLINAHANIEIRLFNPFANRNMRAGDFITDTSRVNHRMHNKTLTIDNQVTVFGGRNIGDEYMGAAEEVGFSDLDAMAIGPIAQEISNAFDVYWNSQWVYPLDAFAEGEPVTKDAVATFRKQLTAYIDTAQMGDYAKAMSALSLLDVTSINDIQFEWGRWVLVYDASSKVDAKAVTKETHLAPQLKQGLDRAQNEIIIVSPYFVPGSQFAEYLVDRVSDGVSVRILTNSLAANDVALVHSGYMRYRKQLIAGGVELFEYRTIKSSEKVGSKNAEDGSSWKGAERTSLHGKYFAFDQRDVFIGSFNLDARSVELNTELGVYFESPAYAQALHNAFDGNIAGKAYRVLLDDNGKLVWEADDNGKVIRYSHEPDTSLWKRLSTRFLSWFVPESQL